MAMTITCPNACDGFRKCLARMYWEPGNAVLFKA